MSSSDPSQIIAGHLTYDRLRSYSIAVGGDIKAALQLYDWNSAVSGALHEDLGRVEVVLRNALDNTLVLHGTASRWITKWYDRPSLFPGRHGQRAIEDIAAAKRRSGRSGQPALHGAVIAELTFGFWRYLCTPAYLTSMWVPALSAAFPSHPAPQSPRVVRSDVEDRVQRLHFLRNRVAHHEPIHHRDIARDHTSMTDLIRWISPEAEVWFDTNSRTRLVLAARP
jgi:hypothetical protein